MVIFDLDQTLADTSIAADLRRARRWREVMALAPSFKIYPGITPLIVKLHGQGVPLAIVTRSPDMVAKALVARHGWPITNIVGYHHVKKRKPDPEGLLLALKATGVNPKDAIHVGDHAEDTEASIQAGMVAVGAEWGSEDVQGLRASKPHHLFQSVTELGEFLSKRLKSGKA